MCAADIYKLATYKEPNSKEQAEAAVFAAAVLPQVHACSAKNAQIIYDATNMKASRPDYAKSKKAFEQCYKKVRTRLLARAPCRQRAPAKEIPLPTPPPRLTPPHLLTSSQSAAPTDGHHVLRSRRDLR